MQTILVPPKTRKWKTISHCRIGAVCSRLLAATLVLGFVLGAEAILAADSVRGSFESLFSDFSRKPEPELPALDFTGIVPPAVSTKSISLYDGSVAEQVRDIEILGPRFPWAHDRSYSSSNISMSANMGAAWFANNGSRCVVQGSNGTIVLLDNAKYRKTFAFDKDKAEYVSSSDSTLLLEKYYNEEDAAHYFRLTNTISGDVEIFYDLSSSNPGALKERTTRDWLAQGKVGIRYHYSSGLLSSICTAQGQEYFIGFTYSGNANNPTLVKIEVKTSATGRIFKDVAYTYFASGTHSADLGSDGDLVQVRTRELKSGGNPERAADWIIRYTQYRYYRDGDADGVAHVLKAVFEPGAVQRILDRQRDISSADAILAIGDSGGDRSHRILDFADRRFTYHTKNVDTSKILTTVWGSENLQDKYGGNEIAEVDSSVGRYMVKSAVVGGCASCGAAVHGVRHNYYYLGMHSGTSQNGSDVVRVVVDDAIDGNGAGAFRTLYGLCAGGRPLCEALVTDPSEAPRFWCKSWKLSTNPSLLNRLVEYRTPAAHRVTSATIKKFLDPSTGNNDGDTLNRNSGLIEVYDYDSFGFQTAQRVKEGSNGTAHYVWSKTYLGGKNGGRQSLITASCAYPQLVVAINDASRVRTRYEYEFWNGTDTIKKKTTILPQVPRSQNGSGMHAITEEYYDTLGRLRWTKDGDGYITYYSYHPQFGTESYVVRDADPNSLPLSADKNAPEWLAVLAGSANSNKPTRGVNLSKAIQQVTKSEYDDEGRLVLKVVEDGQAAVEMTKQYTVYEANRTLQFPCWDDKTRKPLMPIEATVTNAGGQKTEFYTLAPRCVATTNGKPVGLIEDNQANYVSWTRNHYDAATGQLVYTDRYHDIPHSGTGVLSANYHREAYLYDAMGRRGAVIQVVSGAESDKSTVNQVRITLFDAMSRPVAVKQGVSRCGDGIPTDYSALASSHSPLPWLKTITQIEYDYDNGDTGNGLITRVVIHHGVRPTDNNGIQLYYTFRGHLRGSRLFNGYNGSTDVSVSPYNIFDVDWLGHTTARATYTVAPHWPTNYEDYADTIANGRAVLDKSLYDVTGHVYREEKYSINSADGSKGSRLQVNYYYDRRGNRVAIAPKYSAAKEIAYDGLGREYQTRTVLQLKGDDGSGFYSGGTFQHPTSNSTFRYRNPRPDSGFASSHVEQMSGGGDKVFTISHKVFDVASNIIETHNYDSVERNASGLNISADHGYVRHSIYSWYDAANRLIAKADYGCGNTTADSWGYAPMPRRTSSAPDSSTTALVTSYGYDAISGRLQLAMNPRGQRTKTFYDALGRTTYVADNYDNFIPPATNTGDPSDHSKDRVTKKEYNGLGKTTKLTILDQNGDGSNNNETTTYLYEDPYNATLLTSTIYPDSSDTNSSGTNQAKIRYNLDGSMASRTDQRGTTIEYILNDRRQLQLESVVALGGSTDGFVRSIKREYDTLGRLTAVTCYGAADGTGPVRNQFVRRFTNYGRIDSEWQNHVGAAVTDGENPSPCVRYGFDIATDKDGIYRHNVRPTQLTYPDGRVIRYQYGEVAGDAGDLLGHVACIYQSGSPEQLLVQYARMASGMVVKVDYAEPRLSSSQALDGEGSEFGALDRFGRMKELLWYNYATATAAVDLRHGYDLGGNLIWREDLIAVNEKVPMYCGESYAYDGLNRLTSLDRGQLRPDEGGIVGDLAREEKWTLDALGNWSRFLEKTNGVADLSQTRSHSKANEIIQIDSSSDHVAHDAVGNMIKMPTSSGRSAVAAYKGSNMPTETARHNGSSFGIIQAAYVTSKDVNEISKPSRWDDHYDLIYDAWNRLVQVGRDGTALAEYEYDGRNFRTAKRTYSGNQLSEARHFYCNSTWQCLEERVEGEKVDKSRLPIPACQYVWGTRYVDDLVLRDRNVSGTNERIYAMQDANWNTVAIADAKGTVQERYVYSAYGRPSLLDASYTSHDVSPFSWDTLYTGRHYDRETGLYYYRSRFFSPELGRFISRDPIEYIGGINLYEYVNGNPINLNDPSGAWFKCTVAWIALAATVVGCISQISALCTAGLPAISLALAAAATVCTAGGFDITRCSAAALVLGETIGFCLGIAAAAIAVDDYCF